jgi:MFS family permease
MPDLIDEFGWSRTAVSLAYSINMMLYVLIAPLAGLLTDRIGPRVVISVGGLLVVLSLVLTSFVDTTWQLYLSYGILGGCGVGLCYMVPNLATVRKWFSRRAGLATGLVAAGSGLGIIIIAPLAVRFINAWGWRTSFIAIGLITGIICIIFAAIFMRKDPESMGLLPDGDVAKAQPSPNSLGTPAEKAWGLREAIHTRTFWLLLIAAFCYFLPVTAMVAHIIMWAQFDLGLGMMLAATTLSAMVIAALIARIVGGAASDRLGKKPVFYISAIGAAAICLYGLTASSFTTLYLFAIVFGFFYGLNVALWSAILGDFYGRPSVGSLYDILSIGIGVAGGVGPLLFGRIYDARGSYDIAFLISAIVLVLGAILISRTRAPQKLPQQRL